MKMISTEAARLRRAPGHLLTIILYFIITMGGFYHYMISHDALKTLPQLLAIMYNGPAYCLLTVVIGLHISSFMHLDQKQGETAMLVSTLKDKGKLIFTRFYALAFRLLLGQLITTGIVLGMIVFGMHIECDEPFYALLVFIEVYLTYLFVASFSMLVNLLCKDEIFANVVIIIFALIPVGAYTLLNMTNIDLTGVLVSATFYELMKDVTIYQGLLASLLALLYTCACLLIGGIVIRSREIS